LEFRKVLPIFETLIAAIQIGLSNPNYNLPLGNQTIVETKVETDYLTKPIIVETIETPPDPPKAVYKTPQARVSNFELLYEDYTNNCVAYAKRETGIYRTMGLGGMSAIQGHEPQVGAIGVLPSHAVVVESVENGIVQFRESNYKKNWITRRSLPVSSFLGFIYQ
jgi:hypothetical protein